MPDSLVRPHVGTMERRVLDALKADKYGNWTRVFTEDQLIRVIDHILEAAGCSDDLAEDYEAQLAAKDEEIDELNHILNEQGLKDEVAEVLVNPLEGWRP